MSRPAAAPPATAAGHVTGYKSLLRDVLTMRPSGTRQRLALALGKHPSFISQITNPAYPVPIPAQHIATIFQVCHLSPAERTAFLQAYRAAHPRRLVAAAETPPLRVVTLSVPDRGPAANRSFDEALRHFAARAAARGGKGPKEEP